MSDVPSIWESIKRRITSPDKNRTTDRDITNETISRAADEFRNEVLNRRTAAVVQSVAPEPLMRTSQIETHSQSFSGGDARGGTPPPAGGTAAGTAVPLYVSINGTIYEMLAVHQGLTEV